MRSSPSSHPSPLRVYVSAASRGIAFETARQFALTGADVAISGRNADRLEAARIKILREKVDAQVRLAVGDLSVPEDQDAILAQLDAERFTPDVFVCNSGQPRNFQIDTVSRDFWTRDLEMILGQATFAAQRFAKAMAHRGYGRLMFVSSTLAKSPTRNFITSSIARAGLFALSKALVDQYGDQGVASFVLMIGYVDTPLLRNMALELDYDGEPPPATPGQVVPWDQQFRQWSSNIPVGRIGEPSELARVIRFLTSPEAEYLSGSVLSFAGGLDRNLV